MITTRFSTLALLALCAFSAHAQTSTSTTANAPAANAPAAKNTPITLPNGVVVDFVTVGSGAKPSASNVVRVHYRGTLTNGTEFDSSLSRAKPIEFPLQGVIPCWTTGVAQMPVGSTAKLTCPANTAYGNRAVGGVIPANSVLHFEVQLLDIVR